MHLLQAVSPCLILFLTSEAIYAAKQCCWNQLAKLSQDPLADFCQEVSCCHYVVSAGLSNGSSAHPITGVMHCDRIPHNLSNVADFESWLFRCNQSTARLSQPTWLHQATLSKQNSILHGSQRKCIQQCARCAVYLQQYIAHAEATKTMCSKPCHPGAIFFFALTKGICSTLDQHCMQCILYVSKPAQTSCVQHLHCV